MPNIFINSKQQRLQQLSQEAHKLNKMNREKQRISLNSLINLMQLEVKCFQHCSLRERFICFQLPEKCPTCMVSFKTRLYPARFKVPPFVLKSPLTNSTHCKTPSFSLLLQPTDGCFFLLKLKFFKAI